MAKRPHGRFRQVILLVAIACVVEASLSMHAQETRPTFSTGVALVPITAVVRDSRDRLVRDLRRDDFQVLENSLPRPVVEFRATDRAPISVALLFDTSGSMHGANLDTGKHVVNRLLDAVDHTSDEVALFTFDNRLRQETPFTNDPDRVRNALGDIDAWGLTSLYDAIAETAKRLDDVRSQRRAVIVLTDGTDTSSALSAAEVSHLASAIDVPVYVIAVVPPRPSRSDAKAVRRDGDLSDLASSTGGDLKYVTAPEHAAAAIATLMAELRQQYFLAIESAAASGWHRLDVRTKRRDLKVRARSGYFGTRFGRTESGG